MAEYIDRKALIGKLEKRYCAPCKGQDGDLGGDWCRFCMASNAIKEVQKTPAADVEPVRHGRWIHEETEGGFHVWSCSRCGRGMNGNPKGTNLYCYHCGAKMDLEGETNDD